MSSYTLSKEEIRQIVADGVEDAFIKMGIQTDDPLEMQRDFQHLREWRTNFEAAKRKSFLSLTAMLVTGLVAVLVMGARAYLER